MPHTLVTFNPHAPMPPEIEPHGAARIGVAARPYAASRLGVFITQSEAP